MTGRGVKGNPLVTPSLRSDAEAEKFVATANLADYDLSGFKPMRFEFEAKSAAHNMRLPKALLDPVKRKARAKGSLYALCAVADRG